VLRRIAVDRHVAVVCTLHQPRSSLWTLFDDVMVFAQGGRVAYHGPRCVTHTPPSPSLASIPSIVCSHLLPPSPYLSPYPGPLSPPSLPPPLPRREGVLPHFARLGHPCPPHTNVAEFLVDLVSVDTTTLDAATESSQRIDRLVEAFERTATPRPTGSGSGSGGGSRGTGKGSGGGGTMAVHPPSQTAAAAGAAVAAVFRRPWRLLRRSLHRFRLLLGRALRQVSPTPHTHRHTHRPHKPRYNTHLQPPHPRP